MFNDNECEWDSCINNSHTCLYLITLKQLKKKNKVHRNSLCLCELQSAKYVCPLIFFALAAQFA